MVAVSTILYLSLFLFLGIHGRRFRTPCLQSSSFRCDNGNCINKHLWCNYNRDCSDSSDEMYCQRNFPRISCDDTIHFRCKSDSQCIPIEGYCDGYSSCADQSDEKDCPCEELQERAGNIQYEAFVGNYRTHHKCWKLVVKEGQYVNLSIEAILHYRDCKLGNVTLISPPIYDAISVSTSNPDYYYYSGGIEKDNNDYLICPTGINPLLRNIKTFTYTSDIKIVYLSNWYTSSNNLKDLLNITYYKVDNECLDPEAFKCSKNSCIKPGKECDGIADCENGLDEQKCDFATFSATYLLNNRKNVTKWMRRHHDADWGWKENTHRAVVALYLDHDLNLSSSLKDDELIAKQLELEVSMYLLRDTGKISPTELSTYINALMAICHDPRNFYGFDLILKLKEEIEKLPKYTTPLPYLTLCNANENISEEVVSRLFQTLESSSDYGFVLEVQALVSMALSCISNTEPYEHLKQNITDALNALKGEQREDGSFGNEYTTALVLQALIANNQANTKGWNFKSFKSAIEFLRQKQKADGSFGDFLTTYLIMPILNGKSFLDLGKVNCTESLRRPREGNLISHIKSRLGGKVPVKYSLFIGSEKDQIHPIVLRTPKNITVLELMELAADMDPKYKFKTHQIKKKTYVYEISGTPNDPENNIFWFFYRDVGNGTIPILTQSPEEIRVNDNDHIIAWYKTLIL